MAEGMGAIAKALAAAQAEVKNAAFDSVNPHFKSKYTSLAALRDAVVPVFAGHGVAIIQTTEMDGEWIMLRTTAYHESGEWVYGVYPVCHRDTPPQQAGSAMTYARRYTLAAFAGIAGEEDDDANAAQKKPEQTARITPQAEAPKRRSKEQLLERVIVLAKKIDPPSGLAIISGGMLVDQQAKDAMKVDELDLRKATLEDIVELGTHLSQRVAK